MSEPVPQFLRKNPLEVSAALLFGVIFVAAALHHAPRADHLGSADLTACRCDGSDRCGPVYSGVHPSAEILTPVNVAAMAIAIAAASNNTR